VYACRYVCVFARTCAPVQYHKGCWHRECTDTGNVLLSNIIKGADTGNVGGGFWGGALSFDPVGGSGTKRPAWVVCVHEHVMCKGQRWDVPRG